MLSHPYNPEDACMTCNYFNTPVSIIGQYDVCTDLSPTDEHVRVPLGPVTRARAKQFKESLQTLVHNIQDEQGAHRNLEGLEDAKQVVYTMIQAHEPAISDHACA